eukprot:Hpha_TRINITY_DN7920_c0_g1::TRINITY_DN7920_c0_g1_i1::g.146232::m.146232
MTRDCCEGLECFEGSWAETTDFTCERKHVVRANNLAFEERLAVLILHLEHVDPDRDQQDLVHNAYVFSRKHDRFDHVLRELILNSEESDRDEILNRWDGIPKAEKDERLIRAARVVLDYMAEDEEDFEG